MPNIQEFGSGAGLLYITDLSNQILSNVNNDSHGVEVVKRDAVSRAPVSADINAIGEIVITSAAADNTTDVTVNGVSQISALVANSVGDEAQTAIDIAAAINAQIPASGVNYTAKAIGAKILIIAPSSAGSTVNGHIVAIAVSGATTSTVSPVAGGQDGSGVNSTINGRRYYINNNVSAPQGDITGAIEITNDLIFRGLQHRLDEVDLVIAAGVVSPARTMAIKHTNVDTEGAAGTDNLDSIDIGDHVLGDIIFVAGIVSTRVVTLRDLTITGGNIKLSGEESFGTGSKENVIALRLVEDSVNGLGWHEMWRSPAIEIDATEFFNSGLPIEAGVRQLDIDSVGLPHTDTLIAVPPISESYTNVIHSNPGVLAADFEVELPIVAGAIDGQKFTVNYSATGVDTSGAGDVIIFGNILTETETLNGGVVFEAVLDFDNAEWVVTKYYNFALAKIDTVLIEDAAISTVKIQDDVITNVKMADNSVDTLEIVDDAVTEVKIADGSVTVDKLGASEQKEVFNIPVSFESGEQGEYQVEMPYKCDVIKAISRVSLAVAGTDKANIQLANASGDMIDGFLCHGASAAFGDTQSDSPTTNQEILAGGVIKITTSKTTAGGKAIVTIHVQRKA